MSNLLTKYPELTQVNASVEGIGTPDVTLKSSQLSLNVAGQENLGSMHFCTMSFGTLHLEIGSHRTANSIWLASNRKRDIEINDWTIAWTCAVDKEEIPPSSDEFKEFQNQIKQPGDFSISSLFFPFTSKYDCTA